MKSRNLVWVSQMLLILNYLTSVIAIDICPDTIENGDRSEITGIVNCNTGYKKTKCTSPVDAVDGYEANTCELDVVSLTVAVALMLFLVVVAILLFSIIVRRYRKTRGRSHGEMYVDSNDYVEHQFDTQPAPEQDGYRRKEKENGDRIIEITMDNAATSNDFKYHEHKDEVMVENSEYVSGGFDNDGMFVETGYEGAVGGYDIGAEKRNNRMIDIHAHDDENEIEYNRKSGKSKKNKSSKKKVKKSADKSKQKSSTKLKKKQNTDEEQKTEKDDANGMNAQVNKKPANDISADGLYQSMEELNVDETQVPIDKLEAVNKLTSVDKDVVDNTDEVANEAVYAKVDKEHIAMKKLKRQQDSMKGQRVHNGTPKTYNIPSTPGSHTTGSDEGYGEGIEAH